MAGFMINKYSDPSQRSIKFDYAQSGNATFPYDLRMYLLKIEYLKSYENVGTVKVLLCGRQIGKIDALDIFHSDGFHTDHAVRKVSIPEMVIYKDLHLKCPLDYLQENRFNLELIYTIDDEKSARKTAKFKILSIDVCVPMEMRELI